MKQVTGWRKQEHLEAAKRFRIMAAQLQTCENREQLQDKVARLLCNALHHERLARG